MSQLDREQEGTPSAPDPIRPRLGAFRPRTIFTLLVVAFLILVIVLRWAG